MKTIDKIMNFFGYVDSSVVEKAAPKGSDIPAPSVVDRDDMDMPTQSVDYWGRKIRETLYIDDTDKLRYAEINSMDNEVPEITAALDVNADFIVYPNEQDKGKTLKVSSTNAKAQAKIDEVDKRVSLQDQFFPMIRAMLKYGDNAEELVTNMEKNKFLGFRNIPINTVIPVMNDGFPNQSPRIHQIIGGRINASLDDDEVFHLSLSTDRERYCKFGKGTSMVEHSRLLYRQLRLMEEGMMVTRLSRANQNYAMIVDVGELQGDEALAFLDHYKKRVMRRKYINPTTGKWSWEYNPLSVIEDIMVPTRAGSGGNVVPLNNHAMSGKNIEDIFYCQDKLIYSTGTPKLLIGKEVDVNSKSTSDNQMGTFLRRIRRIQNLLTPEIKKLYQKILKIEGILVSLDELEVQWPMCLTIDEERKMAIEKIKCEIGKMLYTDMAVVDDHFVYTKILGMSDKEADKMSLAVKAKKEDDAEFAAMFSPAPVAADGEDDGEDDEKMPSKEELIQVIKNKLSDKEWEKMQKMVQNNPVLGESIVDLINILQAKSGN